MAELKEMFTRKEEMYKKMVNIILETMPNVVEGARTYIRLTEGPAGDITWEDVSYFEHEQLIMLIGVIQYHPGDKVELVNGMEIEVTEQTSAYFRRLLRLGISYDLATSGSVDDVVDFLVQSSEQQDEEEPDENLVQVPVSDVDNTEFDLDDLTEEQREQLRLFALSYGRDN